MVVVAAAGSFVPSAGAASTPMLAGQVELMGSGSGGAVVQVPEGAALDFNLKPDGTVPAISVAGSGRVAGFFLRSLTTSDYFLAYRLPQALKGTTYLAQAGLGTSTCFFAICPVPAGRYELYLIGDASPLQVTMNIIGPSGSQQFCTQAGCPDDGDVERLAPVESQVETPANTLDLSQQPGGAVRSTGTSVTMKTKGLLFGVGWGTGSSRTLPIALPPPDAGGPSTHAEHGLCVYDGPPPPQGFQPVCPDSKTPLPTVGITTIGVPYGYADLWIDTQPSPGTQSIGAYQAVAGTSDGFGLAVVRLEALPHG